MKTLSMTLALLSVCAMADNSKIELKGLQIGMSEQRAIEQIGRAHAADAKHFKTRPAVKCADVRDKTAADRTCTSAIAITDRPASITLYFFADALGAVQFNVNTTNFADPRKFEDITEALAEKFGPPTSRTPVRYAWKTAGQTINADKYRLDYSNGVYVWLTSDDYTREQARRRKALAGENAKKL